MSFVGAVLLWTLLLPAHLTVEIAKFPLAPIAVLCCDTDDKKHLETPFEWLDTVEDSLDGDYGWKTEHVPAGEDPLDYWNRVEWLWRNGAQRYNYLVEGIKYDKDKTPEFTRGFNIREDGYWLYRNYWQYSETDAIEIMWGWCFYCTVEGYNKFAFTNRHQAMTALLY